MVASMSLVERLSVQLMLSQEFFAHEDHVDLIGLMKHFNKPLVEPRTRISVA